MSPIALLAVILCAGGYAVLDTLRKTLAGQVRPMPLLVYLALGPAPLFAAWWAADGGGGPAGAYWLPAVASTALNVAANLAMLEAVRVSPLSLTIPLLSLTPAFTALLAVPVLGERLGVRASLGIALVVAGAFALHVAPGAGASLGEVLRAFRRERGSVLMAGVALLWSLTPPLDKLAMESSSAPFHGMALNAGVGIAALGLLAARSGTEGLRVSRRSASLVLAAVSIGGIALGAQLFAFTLLPVGAVETLKRAFGNVAAVALGAWLFRERVTAGKLAAIVLMAAGVALIVSP